MKKLLRNYILLSILANAFFANAQTMSPRLRAMRQKLAGALTEYYKRYPQEKVFLHTDQNVYLGGQTIWYKAYTMAYGKPSHLSGIMYLRLSDTSGKQIIQDKLPLKNSTAYGNITLPDSLPTGWYSLQAFTAWMLNFDQGGIYRQNIYIQNIRDTVSHVLVNTTAKAYHINFFPEGGDMVDGNICNVAFKAVDENGLPVKVEGEILDNSQKSVAKLITIHDGMGSFELEADAGKSYTAQVHFPDGSVQPVALPPVKKTGITLRINTTAINGGLEVRISCSNQSEQHKDVIVVAEQNNGTSVLYPLRLNRGINVVNLNANSFSTGVLRLTVFGDTGLPVAERVAFISNNDQLQLALSGDKLSFAPKSENEFILNIKDKDGQTVKANLSVAITDAGVGTEPDDNICSWLLMSSELRGYIHQPAYYFKNNSDTLRRQLDLVMLTSGWRHFKWDTLLNNTPVKLNYFVENAQLIAGKIENYQDKDNLRIKLLITNSDSSKNVASIRPTSEGIFVLKDYDRRGTANISYEVVNKKNRRQAAKVTFFTPAVDTVHFAAETPGRFAETEPVPKKTYLDSLASAQRLMLITKGIMLKTVNIKEKQLTPTELLIQNHVKRLTTDNATTFDFVNSPTPPSGAMNGGIIGYLQGRIAGLQITYNPVSGWTFAYHGQSSLSDTQPAFYIDEATVALADIIDVPLSEIAMVRFAPAPVWFAPLNGGFVGAILVYTKRFGDEKYSYSNGKGFGQYTFNSYSVTREFPSPDYSNAKQRSEPDYRTTLFWAHDLNTDDYGKVKIHFYNSDKAKKYRIIIQAVDADGRVGFLNEMF